MVIEQRKTRVFLPNAAKKIQEIQDIILQILYENGIKERIIFPMTSSIDLYEKYYDDIKKEYLLDFYNSEGDVYVYHPEYRTFIKDYSEENFSGIKDYNFYYLQNCISYTSVDREYVKEDTVLGMVMINPNSEMESWSKLSKILDAILTELVGKGNYSMHFNNNASIDLLIHGVLIGHSKNDFKNGLLEAHFSLTDLYEVLNK